MNTNLNYKQIQLLSLLFNEIADEPHKHGISQETANTLLNSLPISGEYNIPEDYITMILAGLNLLQNELSDMVNLINPVCPLHEKMDIAGFGAYRKEMEVTCT